MSIEVSTVTTRRAGMYSPSESGSDYPPYQQQAQRGLADTPSSGKQFKDLNSKLLFSAGCYACFIFACTCIILWRKTYISHICMNENHNFSSSYMQMSLICRHGINYGL